MLFLSNVTADDMECQGMTYGIWFTYNSHIADPLIKETMEFIFIEKAAFEKIMSKVAALGYRLEKRRDVFEET